MPLDPYFTSAPHQFQPTEEMKAAFEEFMALPFEARVERCAIIRTKRGMGRATPEELYVMRSLAFHLSIRKRARRNRKREKNYDKAVQAFKDGKRILVVFGGGMDGGGGPRRHTKKLPLDFTRDIRSYEQRVRTGQPNKEERTYGYKPT